MVDDVPDLSWHSIILTSRTLSLLDQNYNQCEEPLTAWAESVYQDSPAIETPEALAIQIGTYAYLTHDESFRPILEEDIGNTEGQELAKGFIGTRTLEDAEL